MAPTLYLTYKSPPCRTVLFVAKQLNIKLTLIELDLKNNKDQLKPEFIQLNPRHSVPTLVDTDGVVVWESRAIAQYLCNKYASDSTLYPREPDRRARVDTVLQFSLSSWEPVVRDALKAKMFSGVEPTDGQRLALNESMRVLDALIAANDGYAAANHLTIADLSLLAHSVSILYLDYNLDDYPHLKAWYNRLERELPYYKEFQNDIHTLFIKK